MKKYRPDQIEKKWQKIWLEKKVHKANETSKKPKYYQLETFPYPSAAGLHVGHPKGYIAEDIHARFMRMNGREVLYTMGWDAFGLPTENYAIKIGKNPEEVARANIKNFKRQVRQFGFSYDWEREINTSSPEYYKWTQWLFIQLFKKGLAYRAQAKVNWCPKDKTVLANEQVIDGRCERDGTLVEQREMEQWFLKITAYADRLLKDTKGLDWPKATVKRQEDWIGRSEGRLIKFPIYRGEISIGELEVFTTRPDTIDGVTFMVLSPEHPLASKAKGLKAVNPYNKEELPVFVADYVLAEYGTGAIMAVPAYDERDLEFAKKHKLPIKKAPLAPENKWPGEKKVNYKIRDWSISRQRYWGVPIPMIHCSKCGIVPVSEKDLPVLLPPLKNYRPQGMPPLASSAKFINVKCPACGGKAQRDPETLDTFVDSSWYYLRYADLKNDKQFASPEKLKRWLPVDLYIIGAEHTTLHLLYARFITKFLYDQGRLRFPEPFLKLRHLGLILGEDGQKMSKSKGNVVNPDDLIEKFGADALRLYEMFMGPFEAGHPWDPQGIVGTSRFLHRVWNLFQKSQINIRKSDFLISGKSDFQRLMHRTIKKVTEDIENFHFNTAISALMILFNEIEKTPQLKIENWKLIIKLLFPFAPHIAQEMWSQLSHKTLLDFESWPTWDPKLVKEKEFELVIQVNGRVRATVRAAMGISQKEAEKLAQDQPVVQKWLKGGKFKKSIYVDNRLINFIV